MPYSESQRRLFGADYARAKAGKATRTGMSKKSLRKHASMPIKSYMPSGATQSPKGDLGARRVAECDKQRGFKRAGGDLSGQL